MKIVMLAVGYCFILLCATRADGISFREKIQPIIEQHCIECHDADNKQNDFSMMSFRDLMRGGKSGRAVTPGEPDESLLFKKITGEDKPQMPRKRPPLPKETIELIKKWIEQGPKDN